MRTSFATHALRPRLMRERIRPDQKNKEIPKKLHLRVIFQTLLPSSFVLCVCVRAFLGSLMASSHSPEVPPSTHKFSTVCLLTWNSNPSFFAAATSNRFFILFSFSYSLTCLSSPLSSLDVFFHFSVLRYNNFLNAFLLSTATSRSLRQSGRAACDVCCHRIKWSVFTTNISPMHLLRGSSQNRNVFEQSDCKKGE